MSLDAEIREAERRGGLPGPARFVLTVSYEHNDFDRMRTVIGVYTTLEKAQEKAVVYARVRPGLNAAKPADTWRAHNAHGRSWESGDYWIEEFEEDDHGR